MRKVIKISIVAKVVPQGSMFDAEYMSRHITALFEHSHRTRTVFIFRDSEGVNPDKTLGQTHAPLRELRRRHPKLPIHYIIVDHALEGWLLCDKEALRRVLGTKARISLPPRPDSHPDPAGLMADVFAANRKDYSKMRHAPEIAEYADPDAIASRSATFASLAELLRGL